MRPPMPPLALTHVMRAFTWASGSPSGSEAKPICFPISPTSVKIAPTLTESAVTPGDGLESPPTEPGAAVAVKPAVFVVAQPLTTRASESAAPTSAVRRPLMPPLPVPYVVSRAPRRWCPRTSGVLQDHRRCPHHRRSVRPSHPTEPLVPPGGTTLQICETRSRPAQRQGVPDTRRGWPVPSRSGDVRAVLCRSRRVWVTLPGAGCELGQNGAQPCSGCDRRTP